MAARPPFKQRRKIKSRSMRSGMCCARCRGLMVKDSTADGAIYYGLPELVIWRCINCGARNSWAMAGNRAARRSQLVKVPGPIREKSGRAHPVFPQTLSFVRDGAE